MDILANARGHFDKMRNQKIEVPEWGDDEGPAIMYFDPLSLAQRQSLQRQSKGNEARMLALCVILFAKNSDGKRYFENNADTNKAFDNDLDPAVVARVAGAMIQVSGEEDLGN